MPNKNANYHCPFCEGVLNPEYAIILNAKGSAMALLVGLHPEPGDYRIFKPDGTTIPQGTRWDFLCPLCQHDLSAKGDPNLCMVERRVGGEAQKIFFSRISGEEATLVATPTELQHHGKAVQSYAHLMLRDLL